MCHICRLFLLCGCNNDKKTVEKEYDASTALFSADNGWKAVRGNSVEKSDGAYLILSNTDKAKSRGTTGAVYIRVPKNVEEKVAGKKIKVSVVAKSAASSPVTFGLAYSTAQVGNSGWKKFTSTDDFKVYSLEYEIPPMDKEANYDYIGVWGDCSGKGEGVLVKSVSINII